MAWKQIWNFLSNHRSSSSSNVQVLLSEKCWIGSWNTKTSLFWQGPDTEERMRKLLPLSPPSLPPPPSFCQETYLEIYCRGTSSPAAALQRLQRLQGGRIVNFCNVASARPKLKLVMAWFYSIAVQANLSSIWCLILLYFDYLYKRKMLTKIACQEQGLWFETTWILFFKEKSNKHLIIACISVACL